MSANTRKTFYQILNSEIKNQPYTFLPRNRQMNKSLTEKNLGLEVKTLPHKKLRSKIKHLLHVIQDRD